MCRLAQRIFGVMAVLVLMVGCISRRPMTTTMTVVDGGQSRYRIVVPAEPSSPGLRRHLQDTARCLQRCIAEGSGVMLPVVVDNAPELQDGAPFISLGETRAAVTVGLRQSDFQQSGSDSDSRRQYLFVRP